MPAELTWWTPQAPLETVVGCSEPDIAEKQITQWLLGHGVDVDVLGLPEALNAAGWLDPELGPWVSGFMAWLECLRAPVWIDSSIERLHETALGRFDGPFDAERRRQWIGELEGGLARPAAGAGEWELWIPCSAGFFVVYDGHQRAQKRTQPEAASAAP